MLLHLKQPDRVGVRRPVRCSPPLPPPHSGPGMGSSRRFLVLTGAGPSRIAMRFTRITTGTTTAPQALRDTSDHDHLRCNGGLWLMRVRPLALYMSSAMPACIMTCIKPRSGCYKLWASASPILECRLACFLQLGQLFLLFIVQLANGRGIQFLPYAAMCRLLLNFLCIALPLREELGQKIRFGVLVPSPFIPASKLSTDELLMAG